MTTRLDFIEECEGLTNAVEFEQMVCGSADPLYTPDYFIRVLRDGVEPDSRYWSYLIVERIKWCAQQHIWSYVIGNRIQL